jgi:hypothetical protein
METNAASMLQFQQHDLSEIHDNHPSKDPPSAETIPSMPRRVRTIWHYATFTYRTKNKLLNEVFQLDAAHCT